ncbi:MAG: 16S rRNA (guanine(527)-N(7))-methyltransferase RsmG [Deltaproteobacteria bacterium]|nr:16S rRNA (guanine(527)-N(7))-methyltransferase RsmG [Deltaproteobacteria bacterium]
MPDYVPRGTPHWRQWPPALILETALREWPLSLLPTQIDYLLNYFDHLQRWNQRINLIGPDQPPVQIIKHIVDSLSGLLVIPPGPYHLLDIGSGAGLPGLVLKIARPDWQVCLAEPKEKKATFLRHVIRSMNLEGIKVIRARIGEEKGGPDGTKFSLITFRGLGSLSMVMSGLESYLEPEALILAYKGPQGELEKKEFLAGENSRPYRIIAETTFHLPLTGEPRSLILIKYLAG